MSHFNQQVVLVTGAGRGMGAAYARLLGAHGARVVVHDAGVDRQGRGGDSGPALAVKDDIKAAGGQAPAEVHDLATREECEALIEAAVAHWDRLDSLVHSAERVAYDSIEAASVDTWAALRAVNIDAPFWLGRAVWPIMRQQGYGHIVLTISGMGSNRLKDRTSPPTASAKRPNLA